MGKRCVIGGSAGSGKTSVIEALSKNPKTWISEESARAMISGKFGEQGKRFWDNLKTAPFGSEQKKKARMEWELAILDFDIKAFKSAPIKDHDCFFDCGFGEIMAYFKTENIEVPKAIADALKNYRYDYIFLAPVWPELLRIQTPEGIDRAKQFEEALKSTYESVGYSVVMLPLKSPEERADFIMEQIMK